MTGESKTGLANKIYRDETGNCPRCHLPIEGHPQCPNCRILCGPEHEYELTPFRGHTICTACVKSWRVLDRLSGRETTWEEFQLPPTKVGDLLK